MKLLVTVSNICRATWSQRNDASWKILWKHPVYNGLLRLIEKLWEVCWKASVDLSTCKNSSQLKMDLKADSTTELPGDLGTNSVFFLFQCLHDPIKDHRRCYLTHNKWFIKAHDVFNTIATNPLFNPKCHACMTVEPIFFSSINILKFIQLQLQFRKCLVNYFR